MNALRQTLLRTSATAVLALAALFAAVWMWNRYERSPWTRNGRVRAEIVRVTPDVGGLVTSVSVRDNQSVSKGALLFAIDQPRYALSLDRARAAAASAEATLNQARREAARDLSLGNLVSREAHEQNLARVEVATAALAEAQTAARVAQLNLDRTSVRASVNGVVTNLDLHPGDYVDAGRQAMALVDTDSLRVEGYFEETKLSMIRVGAKANVYLMGDDRPLRGHVESVAAGINDATRSDSSNLLPNVEPTFSWVRLAQRIPVRIRIDGPVDDAGLIVGRTATVTIEREDG